MAEAKTPGTPVIDNLNLQTAGPRGPALLQDVWLLEEARPLQPRVIPRAPARTATSP